MHTVGAFAIVGIVFFGLDMLWLGAIAKKYYRRQLGPLLADAPKILPAAAFYLLYPIGVITFVSLPASGLGHAAVLGAAFGFFAYMTYDLSNWATLRNWPAPLTFVDIAWGTAATSIAAIAGTWVLRH